MARADRRARKHANKAVAREQRYAAWKRARRRRRLTGVMAVGLVVLLGASLATFLVDGDDGEDALTPTTIGDTDTTPTTLVIDPGRTYRATIETSMGTIVAEMDPTDPEVSAGGVNNFVALARAGFYDGLTFHRVVSDFVIQGGDPEGTGTGGPGYQWGGSEDVPEGITYELGDLAYANSTGPETSGSQFFIATGDTAPLDAVATYIKFGRVVEGLEVAQAIEALEEEGTQTPSETVTIERVVIEEL